MNRYIMVVDDSPTIRMSVELALKGQGFPVKHAVNGRDALSKIEEIKNEGGEIALCISDVNMPEMDGLEFIAEFRKCDRFTPLLVLTTEREQETIVKGKNSGASGWIVKPFSPDELLNVVKRFIK